MPPSSESVGGILRDGDVEWEKDGKSRGSNIWKGLRDFFAFETRKSSSQRAVRGTLSGN